MEIYSKLRGFPFICSCIVQVNFRILSSAVFQEIVDLTEFLQKERRKWDPMVSFSILGGLRDFSIKFKKGKLIKIQTEGGG